MQFVPSSAAIFYGQQDSSLDSLFGCFAKAHKFATVYRCVQCAVLPTILTFIFPYFFHINSLLARFASFQSLICLTVSRFAIAKRNFAEMFMRKKRFFDEGLIKSKSSYYFSHFKSKTLFLYVADVFVS